VPKKKFATNCWKNAALKYGPDSPVAHLKSGDYAKCF